MNNRYSRQSFLGDQSIIQNCRVCIVGLGGGGSAVITQLAHIGFTDYLAFDPNNGLEDKHLNRTFGVSVDDVKENRTKVEIAERVIKQLQPNAQVQIIKSRWQNNLELISQRDIVFGCIDGLAEREQLEIFCRGKTIPYIDIGLGIYTPPNGQHQMSGQIILSMPGHSCMRCMGFLNEESLSREAADYGNAGIRPQVIWGNSCLAGTAVSIAVKLLTSWCGKISRPIYLQYDGNTDTIGSHPRLKVLELNEPCPHFPLGPKGTMVFRDL